MRTKVIIIGGGLAGLAAAIRLAEADYEVVILETRKKLGGRATSFIDPRSGEVLDNCQHVLMGCCTNLMDLYDRLGVLDTIEWHRTLYWAYAENGSPKPDIMQAGWLPAPLHFTGSFRRMRNFSSLEKRAIARAMWKMIRMGTAGRLAWSDRPFMDFLRECNQPQRLVEAFWQTIVISACNMPVERVCASHALHVFQEGFLANKWSYTMGLATVPLWELYEPAVEYLQERGGTIRLGCSAKELLYDGQRLRGVVTDEDTIFGAAMVAALPPDRLHKLCTTTIREADSRLTSLDKFETSPILGVHLWFDRPVMDLPHLILVERGVHWLFNKGIGEDGRQHLHAVISAADEWMELDETQVVERVLADVRSVLPQSANLNPVAWRSVKEKRATFAAVPGIDAIRPRAASSGLGLQPGISNLYLAGDWCDTGWPATMEGAVRSGYAAAAAIAGAGGVVEDVPPGRFAAWLGLR
ncbi:MAG TPA: hydroxysqualene dehydroxylase HpnE [Phycisphaerales bacterium]|nr:hydroxysqualene dehydroxylase HpnE [Phycisphaerales bacterium]HRQ76549.1 hydroxysqualene dehydroxylase HpnE [Phycisphaerales bacterium]